jgi:hypothetical protein
MAGGGQLPIVVATLQHEQNRVAAGTLHSGNEPHFTTHIGYPPVMFRTNSPSSHPHPVAHSTP